MDERWTVNGREMDNLDLLDVLDRVYVENVQIVQFVQTVQVVHRRVVQSFFSRVQP